MNQVESWGDELAANAEIFKERELATKVEIQHPILGKPKFLECLLSLGVFSLSRYQFWAMIFANIQYPIFISIL